MGYIIGKNRRVDSRHLLKIKPGVLQEQCFRFFLLPYRIRGGKDMFRLWAKEFKDNRMLRDMVVCEEAEDTRTHKIFRALDEVCYAFDLSKPIWLDATIDEFKRHAKARFYQDNFVDMIDFDYLEIQVIEED